MSERVAPVLSSVPFTLVCTSVGLWALAAAGLGVGGLTQPAFPFFCGVVALVPLRGHAGESEWGNLLCYAVVAWSVVGLAPLVTIGEALGGPYGGHPMVFVVALPLTALRIRVLASPAVKTWLRP